MGIFRVTDLRVRYARSPQAPGFTSYLNVDGMNVNSMPPNLAPNRIALMLTVFNSGRDCFWEQGAVPNTGALTTLPTTFMTTSNASSGVIASWDVRIPTTGNVEFLFAMYAYPNTTTTPPPPGTLIDLAPTSGHPADSWAYTAVGDAEALLLMALLGSRFRFYNKGDVLNTYLTATGLGTVGLPQPPPPPFVRFANSRLAVW